MNQQKSMPAYSHLSLSANHLSLSANHRIGGGDHTSIRLPAKMGMSLRPQVGHAPTPLYDSHSPETKATMTLPLKTIPLPRSHIHRTNSELQFDEDSHAAEFRDRVMFHRLVAGIRDRRERCATDLLRARQSEEREQRERGQILKQQQQHFASTLAPPVSATPLHEEEEELFYRGEEGPHHTSSKQHLHNVLRLASNVSMNVADDPDWSMDGFCSNGEGHDERVPASRLHYLQQCQQQGHFHSAQQRQHQHQQMPLFPMLPQYQQLQQCVEDEPEEMDGEVFSLDL